MIIDRAHRLFAYAGAMMMQHNHLRRVSDRAGEYAIAVPSVPTRKDTQRWAAAQYFGVIYIQSWEDEASGRCEMAIVPCGFVAWRCSSIPCCLWWCVLGGVEPNSRALASRNPEWTDRAETLNLRLTRQAPGEQKVPNRRHAQTKKIHDTRYLFYRLGRNMYLKKIITRIQTRAHAAQNQTNHRRRCAAESA